MLTQNLKNDMKQQSSDCKITIDEIRQFPDFKDSEEEKLIALREFVYQFSLILYKSHHNETT
mgnify:CR=1 FL=1